MNATDTVIDDAMFRFSGQSSSDTWSLRDQLVSSITRYSKWLVADLHLTMQRIRELADAFPFWQRRKVATDATGYSGRKRPWREVDHGLKATQDWVKTYAAIETDSFIVLSYSLTESNVHDSQMFADVWDKLPPNVQVKRSLADSAYHGEACLAVARQHGAVPLHGIKKNARHFTKPETFYQKMVSFWQHWPNRAAEMYGKRNHAETTFSMIGGSFGHRIKCRTIEGRKNEVRSKIAAHNIRMLAWISFESAN